MKNARGDGKTVVITAGADISSGDVVAVGTGAMVGVAAEDAATGASVTLFVEGEYEAQKVATVVVGDYADHDGTEFTDVGVTSNHAVCTKEVSSTVGWFKLTP